MASLSPLTLVVINQNSGQAWEISTLVRNVSYTTVEPGGCETATFNIPVSFTDRTLIIPNYLQLFYQLRILDEQGCVWIGRLEEVGLDIDENGGQWKVTAYGYGVMAASQVSTKYNMRNKNTMTQIAVDALNLLATENNVSITQNITATGYTINNSGDTTLDTITAAGLLTISRAFGTGGGLRSPIQFTIYPDISGGVTATIRAFPTGNPDLRARLQDFGKASFAANGRSYANRISMLYDSGNSVLTAQNTALQAAFPNGVNMVRTLTVIFNQLHDAGDATQMANTLLNWASAIRLSASGSYTTGGSTRFRNESTGQWTVTPRRVRAGQYMALSDMVTLSSGSTNLAFNNSFLIARTRWDEDSNQLTITPENFESAAERAWAQVRGTIMGRFTV